MAATFTLEVATPEKLVLKADCSEAQIPGLGGALGVLPQHAPLLSELASGVVAYKTGSETHRVVIHGGWVEIQPDYVRVLTNAAEKPNEIDAKRAVEALKRAKTRVEQLAGNVDVARALNSLKRAQARVDASKG
jgi:F-type H+-transporting ATPase subunit epsilon